MCASRRPCTVFAKAGELDLTTASGRMTARIRGAVARQESEHKSERVKRAQLQAAQAGKWRGGSPPIGWDVRPDGSATLDPAAAARIAAASADVLAGVPLGTITKEWNASGFTTGTGKPWGYTQIRQVLTRARNAGLIETHGQIIGPSAWPSIVTEDVWRGVCACSPTRPDAAPRPIVPGGCSRVRHCAARLVASSHSALARSPPLRDSHRVSSALPPVGAMSPAPPKPSTSSSPSSSKKRLRRPDARDLLDRPAPSIDLVQTRAEVSRPAAAAHPGGRSLRRRCDQHWSAHHRDRRL